MSVRSRDDEIALERFYDGLAAVLSSAQGLTLQFHDFKSLHDEDVTALLRQLEEVGAVEAFLGDDDE